MKDSKSISFLTNLSSGYLDVPYLLEETLKMLDDDNPLSDVIPDNNKIALCNMMSMYFNSCWSIYIDDIAFDKLIPYGKIEVYKIDAYNGLRYATVKEVEQGVKGLIGENIYPAGEEEYKKLCLLYWTFTGRAYYFRQAGYKLEYTEDGKVATPLYTMIQMSALQLKEIFDWVQDEKQFKSTVKKIEKMRKSRGYKYASYERDEVTEDITIKQLIYNIYRSFPRNSPNPEYRKALAMAIKSYKNKEKLTPLEISTLREIYDKHALDGDRNRGCVDEAKMQELKNVCEAILAEQFSGKINPNHFAFTIINTLKRNNYTRCSEKQKSYIDDAYKLINRDIVPKEKEAPKTEVISDDEIDNSLMNISNAIGSGLFDDEDEEE